MPRFRVDIQGEGLERAEAALEAAGLLRRGPTSVARTGENPRIVPDIPVHAVVEAVTAEQAEARVRNALPADGEFTVTQAEPFPLKQPD